MCPKANVRIYRLRGSHEQPRRSPFPRLGKLPVADRTANPEPGPEKANLNDERPGIDRLGEIAIGSSATSLGEQDHYHSVLARMVSSVTQDHGQLRSLVYEFARRKLRKDLVRQFEDGDWSEIERQVSTLEEAISELETDFSHGDVPRLPFGGEQGTTTSDTAVSAPVAQPLPPISQKKLIVGNFAENGLPSSRSSTTYDFRPKPQMVDVTDYTAKTRVERHLRSNFWRTVQLIVAVTLGIALYSAIDRQSALSLYNTVRYGRSASIAPGDQNKGGPQSPPEKYETQIDTPPSLPGISGIPLPAAYGVYALSDGKLTSLDLLPIKPPDPRVAISALINTPSQAHLQAGSLQFVVFRRDFANDAPDRVSVRVVAQVTRALTFDAGGKAAYVKVEPTWVIRSQSYQMSVAPAAGNPEMVVIKPESADFTFAPGRYALVLKKDAYDFTVDGPVTDTAHCLERTDALSGAVYSECPKTAGK